MNARPRGRPAADGAPRRSRDIRLPLYRNPLRLLFSASLWRAAWFLIAYVFAVGWALFAAAFTATVIAVCVAYTLVAFPVLVAAAGALRGCAHAERWRLRGVLTEPVRGGYRSPERPGFRAEASTRWKDPATWRDVAYLVGLWPPLFILDTTVLCIWVTFLAGVVLPAWYWAVPGGSVNFVYSSGNSGTAAPHGFALGYFPHGPDGPGAVGLYVDTLPRALLAAACFLVVFLLLNYIVVLTARAHVWVARSVLRAPADPLAPAKQVLAEPGPLGPLTTRIQNGGSPVSHPT
jgi:Putative sensor